MNYAARLQKKIPQSYIDELLGAIHISDIVKSRINLRENHDNRGISYSANCPFHDDQALSLHIDDNTGTYTCNTCDITGTSIGFIMYFDGIHFIDAVQELSQTCGMSLSSVVSDQILNEPQKKHVHLLSDIADYFHEELSNHNDAIHYLHDRGISNESIKRFNIGYAPENRDYFQSVFPNKKTPLIRAGVCGENTDKTTFARFRDRIMFPVYSHDKEIVGFGGRSLVDNAPKYLNSPSSRYFSKSEIIFGLSHYEPSSRDSSSTGFDAIVVEGYMDVVVAHQHGFQYTVSPLGTAITSDHITTLKRAFRNVCFCFDGDAAGLAASQRALDLALPFIGIDFRVSFCLLPDGEDPDSILTNMGKDEFARCISNALTETDFLIQSRTIGKNMDGIGPKAALCAELKPHIRSISDQSLKIDCVEALSDLAGIELQKYME